MSSYDPNRVLINIETTILISFPFQTDSGESTEWTTIVSRIDLNSFFFSIFTENKPLDTASCVQADCPPVSVDEAAELHGKTDRIITAHPLHNNINYDYEWHFTSYGQCSSPCLGGKFSDFCLSLEDLT